MRITVEGIPAAGRLVEFALTDAWAADAATHSLEATPEQLKGTMTLHLASRRAGLVRVEGTVSAEAPADCDRCGESCGMALAESFTLLYAPEESGGDAFDGGEIELKVDDLDLGWYSNGEVDLGAVLREAVALALPTRVTCTDVVECDKRTNLLLAAGAAQSGHPAFQALAGLQPGPEDPS